MKKRRFLVFLLFPFALYGQIETFVGILENPAETGIEKHIFYLQQNAISQLPSAPSFQYGGISHLFTNKKSGDKLFKVENVGAGGVFRIEQTGFHSDIRLEAMYSFRIGSEKSYLNFGLSPTLHRRSYNLSKLNPKDLNDGVLELLPENSSIFDLNVGVYWYFKPISVSIAAFDIANHQLKFNDHYYSIDYSRYFKAKFTYKYEKKIFSLTPSLSGQWRPGTDYFLLLQCLAGFLDDKIICSFGTGLHDFGSLSELSIFGTIGYSVSKVNCFIFYGYNTSGLYKYSQGDLGIGLKYNLFNQIRNIER